MSSVQQSVATPPRVTRLSRHHRHRSFEIHRYHSSKIKSQRSIAVHTNIHSSLQIHPESNKKAALATNASSFGHVTKLIDCEQPTRKLSVSTHFVKVSRVRLSRISVPETGTNQHKNDDGNGEYSSNLEVPRQSTVTYEKHKQESVITKNSLSSTPPSHLITVEPDIPISDVYKRFTTNGMDFLGNTQDLLEKEKRSKRRRFLGYYRCPYSPLPTFLCVLGCLFLGIAIAALIVGLVIKFKQTSVSATTIEIATSTTTMPSIILPTTTATTTGIITIAPATTVPTTTVVTTGITTTEATTLTTAQTTTMSTSTTSKASVFNVNLLTNGDAETGLCALNKSALPPTGWNYNGSVSQINYNNTATTNISSSMPAPNDRGQCFFYGAQDTYTSMWQTVDLTTNVDPSLIDNFTVKFNLSAWIGGMLGQNDYAVVSLIFTDQFNQTIGNGTSIGPVTAVDRGSITAFLFRQTNGLVPISARFLTVSVAFTLFQGGTNNGYADNIGVYLYQ